MNALLEKMIEASQAASEVIRAVYETRFVVDYKAPSDPVTEADRRANALIVEMLSSSFPDIPIVAEESDPKTFAGYVDSERVFFVDPLDGTKEFIDRNGEFVVMIGLLEGDAAKMGVVQAPAQKKVWAGVLGEGAYSWEEGGTRQPIARSDRRSIPGARVVASRSHRSERLEQVLAALGGSEVVALGSAGLKGASIAMGGAEIYVGPGRSGKRWDACAVDAIVRSAGGMFTDAFGVAFDYRKGGLDNVRGILATNGWLHEPVLERIAPLLGAPPDAAPR